MRKIYYIYYSPKKAVEEVYQRTDELKDPGQIASRGHCGSHKGTEAAMVRPHKDGRRISSEESDRLETRL